MSHTRISQNHFNNSHGMCAVFIYICGACAAFLMICGGSFQALLQRFILSKLSSDLPEFLSSRWLSVITPALLIILPLSLLPNMAALAAASTLAFAVYSFNIATVACEFIRSVNSRPDGSPMIPPDAEWVHWNFEAIKAVPIMMFAYQCHVQSVPIFAEMTITPRLLPCCSGNGACRQVQGSLGAKLKGAVPVYILTFVQCTVLYLVMGVSGYLLFPVDTKSNILDNFGGDDNIMLVVRILVGCAVALHYPIDLHVARTALYDLVCGCVGKVPVHPAPYVSLAQCTLAIWSGSLITACLVTDLGTVFQVLGGVACTLFIFILPGLMLLLDDSDWEQLAPETGDAHPELDNKEQIQDSREAEGAVSAIDEIPLLVGEAHCQGDQSTTLGHGASCTHTGIVEAMDVDEIDAGVCSSSAELNYGAGGRSLENSCRRRSCATRVLGWVLVSIGACVMCLTVYLTLFW
jgi:hypothetical protein